MKKLAVIFPGIGYTCDRPFLYFGRKLAEAEGYEALCLEFKNLPRNSRGNRSLMAECAKGAMKQTKEQLSGVDFASYDQVVFLAKSIGTIAAGRYAADYLPAARLVLYTPLEATFEKLPHNHAGHAIAFLGESDPWSDVARVKHLAANAKIPLYSYEDCNHSLETGDALKNIDILKDVMEKTKQFLRK